ncbi:hypothetical protein E2C01_077281 [Portunus trituberculatus]|uniref:Uncharacterized protein n=1 Tax=Portunus trituberculatus TaxID=210409 RepID=A0A5B7ILM3_PORTR|nr:hypothetical protein [Portunus trituberculatus]
MRGVTLVRRCRFRRTVPQHAAAAPHRPTAASDRVSWGLRKHTVLCTWSHQMAAPHPVLHCY